MLNKIERFKYLAIVGWFLVDHSNFLPRLFFRESYCFVSNERIRNLKKCAVISKTVTKSINKSVFDVQIRHCQLNSNRTLQGYSLL